MRLSELNPIITGCLDDSGPYVGCNEFSFDCPICKCRIVIHCRLNGPANQSSALWEWRIDLSRIKNNSWDAITVQPSIQNHPVSRKEIQCAAHISILNGEVILAGS